jgi:hypothetical protein
MSLNDELKAASRKPPSTTEWIAAWRKTLKPADRKTVDNWIAKGSVSAATMTRVMRNYGFTGAESTVRNWVRTQRELSR